VIVVVMESVAMSGHRADTSEQGFKFVPKEWPNSYGAQVEEVGQASHYYKNPKGRGLIE
jgi:hypothetical protein